MIQLLLEDIKEGGRNKDRHVKCKYFLLFFFFFWENYKLRTSFLRTNEEKNAHRDTFTITQEETYWKITNGCATPKYILNANSLKGRTQKDSGKKMKVERDERFCKKQKSGLGGWTRERSVEKDLGGERSKRYKTEQRRANKSNKDRVMERNTGEDREEKRREEEVWEKQRENEQGSREPERRSDAKRKETKVGRREGVCVWVSLSQQGVRLRNIMEKRWMEREKERHRRSGGK